MVFNFFIVSTDMHVDIVINYDLCDANEYVHRIGRTGRIGNRGQAISFYDPDLDQNLASDLVKKLKESRVHQQSF